MLTIDPVLVRLYVGFHQLVLLHEILYRGQVLARVL